MPFKTPILAKSAFRWSGIVLITVLYLLGFFERLELITIDLRYQFSASSPHPQIALVVIDQETLKEFGQWPLPRHYYAEVVTTLKKAGTRLTALDLDFSTPSMTSEDQKLVDAVQNAGNVILGAFYEEKMLQNNVRIRSANLPYMGLSKAAAGIGNILFPIDPDGAMRRAYLEDEINGRSVLTLAAELTQQHDRLSSDQVGREGPNLFRLGQHRIPTGKDGTFYIHFIGGAQSFPTFSFADVLQGRINPDEFHGKIVLIGASAMELKDIWKTPFSGLTSGVEIQANALHTLLSGQAVFRIPPWITIMLILSGVLVLDLPMTRSVYQRSSRIMIRFFLFTGLTLILALIIGGISFYLFKFRYLMLDTVPILTAFLVHYLFTSFAFNLYTSQAGQVRAISLSTLHSVGKLSFKDQPLRASMEMVFTLLKDPLNIKIMMTELFYPKIKPSAHRITLCSDSAINNNNAQSEACRHWINRVMDTKESVIVPDLKRIFREPTVYPQPMIQSSLFVPLMTQNQHHGVLHVHSAKPRAFDEEDAKMLYTIANQLAMNIENLELLKEVKRLFHSCIEGFSTALEFKDNETEGHCQRVAGYAAEIARHMDLDSDMEEMIRQGAMLHDIGKIGVPDAILKSPGKLNPKEWEIMKKHPEFGYEMLKNINFPDEVTLILLQHHERYDGSGYPSGIKGEKMFIGARIFTLVDTYDAIRSDRPYRKGSSHETACEEIQRCSGTQFDSKVVEVFLKVPVETMENIRQEVDTIIKTRGLHTILNHGKSLNK